MEGGRDLWWDDLLKAASADCPPVSLPSEHPLFILYTSGTTGKPKGVVHTTGGYLLGAHLTTKVVFDLREDDIFWCTADVGWVTGHSYMVYGPLSNGTTTVMYEGAPDHPEKDRFWSIIERRKVSIFYTAPTAIRAFVRWGDDQPGKHDLSSLRLLGSVGEPINPEAWMWYHEVIGGGRCPIVDTWWQTRNGRHHDDAAAGDHRREAGKLRAPVLRGRPAGGQTRRHAVRAQRRRLPGDQEAVAVDVARHTRRSGAVREAVLVRGAGRLLHR
jgi:acetyl-CoA synthetase